MLLRLLSKPWPIGITSLAGVVKEKSLYGSAAPEKKEDAISFFTKTRTCNSY
jgi:hypothetical protein